MVRGRKKFAKTVSITENTNLNDSKRKDSKPSKKFKGKLSHSSPLTHPIEITRYFHPETSPLSSKEKENINTTAKSALNDRELLKHLNVTEGESCKDVEDEKNSCSTPHKIQGAKDEPPLTPSNILALLHISATPKKATKSRRRLNPSQSSNQQVLAKSQSRPKTSVCKPVASVDSNHKLTEYFPVRRSERKTKRAVLEERQHSIEQAILSQKEEGLEVHNFEGKGRGIVATRHFYKGEFVVEYAGELIDMTVAKEREAVYAQDQNTGCYMYYFKHRNIQYCIDATAESGKLGRLVNHSRNGNLVTKTVTILNKPHLVLIAKEDIQPGDEIMYDYGDRSKESIRYHPWLTS